MCSERTVAVGVDSLQSKEGKAAGSSKTEEGLSYGFRWSHSFDDFANVRYFSHSWSSPLLGPP